MIEPGTPTANVEEELPPRAALRRSWLGGGMGLPGIAWRASQTALSLLITFFGLLLVTFLIGRVIPIDPVLADHRRARHARRSTKRRAQALGLDQPLWMQFAIYVRDVAHRRFRQVAPDRPAGVEDIARVFPRRSSSPPSPR